MSNQPSHCTPLKQGTKPIAMTEIRRPPSSRSFRSSSPKIVRSRPSSASGFTSSSRPTTPLPHRAQEQYTGTITVSIRPNPHSVDSNGSPWQIDEHSNRIFNSADSSAFAFDNVFGQSASITNKQVYHKCCLDTVRSFLEGYNGTIFAYGMTGSGKTYSMKGNDQDPGFIRLAIDDIFRKIEHEKLATRGKEFELSVTYLEIYNERIIDLLSNAVSNQELRIRDDPVYGTKIVGMTSPIIQSQEQLLQLIKRGDNKRKTSATDYNSRSSRSHAILQIRLACSDHIGNSEQHSILSLCDLAGSERATSSLERRKEGSYINKSLLALSTVINKLSLSSSGLSLSNMTDHIPYRDSKLTRLLQPALSGSSLILILCTIHLGSINNINSQQFVGETYNTLRFAARAKDIVISVNKNKQNFSGRKSDSKTIEELRKLIETQKNEISMLKLQALNNERVSYPHNDKDFKLAQLIAENKLLNEKYEHSLRLNDIQKTETVILRNDALNELLGSGIDSGLLQSVVENLEEFYRRVNYEVEEYKSYVNHLENQLRLQTQDSVMDAQTLDSLFGNVKDKEMEILLKEQEEEIMSLREAIKDKDHIIKSLTKTTKLRKLVEGIYDDNSSIPEKPVDSSNKVTIREFNIKSKKPQVDLDVY